MMMMEMMEQMSPEHWEHMEAMMKGAAISKSGAHVMPQKPAATPLKPAHQHPHPLPPADTSGRQDR